MNRIASRTALVGGVVADGFGWRWIFAANLPVCAATLGLVPRLVSETRDDARRPIDLVGIALLTLALGLLIESLLQLGHRAVSLASAVVFAAFVLQQRRRATPVLDPVLLRQKAMIAVSLLLITVSIAYWALLVYLPLFLQTTFGFAAERTGMVMLAATLPMVVLPPFAGALAPRWGWRRLFATGLAVIAAGDLVLASAPSLWVVLVGLAVIAIGAALVQAQLSGAVVALAPAAQAGMASALTIVMRQGGFAIGIAALGAVLGPKVGTASRDIYSWMFLLAAVAALIGAASAFLIEAKRAP